MGYVRCDINTGVHTRADRADVSLRDVTIARDGKCGLASANDVTHRKRAEDFGNLKKVRRVETRHRTRRLAFASSWGLETGAARDGGRQMKSQNRKIEPLSSYVKKPLNSKVIKSFVPEQRSRMCFSCFEISMFCPYGHSVYVSHMAVSGYGTVSLFHIFMGYFHIFIFLLWSNFFVLFCWVLWHINPCRLFNAKSIFMWITSSISNNLVYHEYTV